MTDRTLSCLMLSFICISLVFPCLVLIVALASCSVFWLLPSSLFWVHFNLIHTWCFQPGLVIHFVYIKEYNVHCLCFFLTWVVIISLNMVRWSVVACIIVILYLILFLTTLRNTFALLPLTFYCISLDKRTRHGDRNRTLILLWFGWNLGCGPLTTLTLCAEKIWFGSNK